MTPKIILFLNENPLPPIFTQGTIAGKELRLRAAIQEVKAIHIISRRGQTVADPSNSKISKLEEKIHIHLLPPWPYYFAGIPLFFWGLYYCLKFKPDIIEAESPIISGPAAILLGKFFGKATVVEVRASYNELIRQKVRLIPLKIKQQVLDLIMFGTLRKATKVIANSKLYQKQLAQKGIVSTIINPGLQYAPKQINRKVHKILGVGYLGRLVPEKGVDILIKAFSLIKQNQPALKIQLYIAGDGPEKIKLEQLVRDLKIEQDVKFLGFTNNYQALSGFDILVNPNTVNHPLEMANAEAAYMGVPVVCFGDNDIPETVIDNITGIKVKEQTAQALNEALIKLIYDKALRIKLARKSRDFVLKNYAFETQVYRLIKLYNSQ